jgi:hypothetical protein
MLLRTSTLTAPWTVVESNFKWFGRVKCLKTIVGAVSRALDYKPADPVGRGGPKGAEKKKARARMEPQTDTGAYR